MSNHKHLATKHHRKTKKSGFTIVEALIVLAIAGLILTIIFLIVPTAMRNRRNLSRKHEVDFIAAQFDAFKANYGHYPIDGTGGPDDRCNFIKNYVRSNGTTTCNNDSTPYLGVSQNCKLGNSELYAICFHGRTSSHDYIAPYDEISIELGHFCSSSNASPDKYIESTSGTDGDATRYVIWTSLESAPYYCVDNYNVR